MQSFGLLEKNRTNIFKKITYILYIQIFVPQLYVFNSLTRVHIKKNTGIFLKFPLFCHAIKEIQSRENSYLHIALDFLVENILT